MKNIFKKEKAEIKSEVNTEEKDKSMYFYLIIFFVIVIVALILRYVPAKEEKKQINIPQQEETTDNILDYLGSLRNNNFDMELNIIRETDILNVIVRKENINKELISKTYRDETFNYYRNNLNVYLLAENKYDLVNNVKFYNEYDETFLNVENIVKLIDNSDSKLDLEEESYHIRRYKITTDKILEIYNNYNNKNVSKTINGITILDINYTDDKLLEIRINLTNFYQNLDYKYRSINYNMYFDNIGNVNIENVSNIINE